MAVIVNNPAEAQRESDSSGWVVGLIILLVVLFALFYYGLPALKGAASTPTFSVPSTIDVNLNQPGTNQAQ